MADAALRELHGLDGQESFFHLVDILLSLSLSLSTHTVHNHFTLHLLI